MFFFSGHGAGHFSGSTNAGGTGASNSAQDQDQFDNRSLWRDNVSSSSSNVQVRGGKYSFRNRSMQYFFNSTKI